MHGQSPLRPVLGLQRFCGQREYDRLHGHGQGNFENAPCSLTIFFVVVTDVHLPTENENAHPSITFQILILLVLYFTIEETIHTIRS